MKQIYSPFMYAACTRCGLRYQIIMLDSLMRCSRCAPPPVTRETVNPPALGAG